VLAASLTVAAGVSSCEGHETGGAGRPKRAARMSDHLGYDKHDPVGRNHGNSRNGVRSKTVLTEIGPVEIEVPGDVDASFQPTIVRKRQRRLTGVDQIVLSLSARGSGRSRRTSLRCMGRACRGRPSPRSPTRCWRR
jgi:putative transposase